MAPGVEALLQCNALLRTMLRHFVQAVLHGCFIRTRDLSLSPEETSTHVDQCGEQDCTEGGIRTTEGPRPVKPQLYHNPDAPSVKCPVSLVHLEKPREASWSVIIAPRAVPAVLTSLHDAVY